MHVCCRLRTIDFLCGYRNCSFRCPSLIISANWTIGDHWPHHPKDRDGKTGVDAEVTEMKAQRDQYGHRYEDEEEKGLSGGAGANEHESSTGKKAQRAQTQHPCVIAVGFWRSQ